jgi:hypothetical protein
MQEKRMRFQGTITGAGMHPKTPESRCGHPLSHAPVMDLGQNEVSPRDIGTLPLICRTFGRAVEDLIRGRENEEANRSPLQKNMINER